MHIILTALLLVAAALLFTKTALDRKGVEYFANAITAVNTTPKGRCTRLADANFTLRYLLCKPGSDASHIAICTAADIPLGVVPDSTPTTDQAASDLSYPLPVELLGSCEDTQRMVASAAIAVGALVVPDAAGKVKTLPVVTGTYYIVGRALSAAGADGDLIEVSTTFPIINRVP